MSNTQYRLLNVGERLANGDEAFSYISGTWEPLILPDGETITSDTPPVRRAVQAAQAPAVTAVLPELPYWCPTEMFYGNQSNPSWHHGLHHSDMPWVCKNNGCVQVEIVPKGTRALLASLRSPAPVEQHEARCGWCGVWESVGGNAPCPATCDEDGPTGPHQYAPAPVRGEVERIAPNDFESFLQGTITMGDDEALQAVIDWTRAALAAGLPASPPTPAQAPVGDKPADFIPFTITAREVEMNEAVFRDWPNGLKGMDDHTARKTVAGAGMFFRQAFWNLYAAPVPEGLTEAEREGIHDTIDQTLSEHEQVGQLSMQTIEHLQSWRSRLSTPTNQPKEGGQ